MEVELVIGTHSIKVDKDILAKHSDYFMAMFTSPFAEQSSQSIILKNMNYKSLKVIIDYMYTGKLALNPANIEEIFLTSDFLQIQTIKQRCATLLPNHIAPCNCLSVYRLSIEHGLEDTGRHALQMILRCFEQIYEDLEFLEFSCDLLVRLLTDYDLNISSELIVVRVVEKWVDHDYKTRAVFKEELLSCVLVELLTKQQYYRLLHSDFLKGETQIVQLLKNNWTVSQDAGVLPREYKPTSHRTVMGDRRAPLSSLGPERVGMINNRVYIIGGLTDVVSQTDIEVFNPLDPRLPSSSTGLLRGPFTNTDTTCCDAGQSAISKVYGAGATVCDSVAYLVGGRTSSGPLQSLYKLELHAHRWQDLGRLPVLSDHVTVTCSDSKVFVIGGYLKSSGSDVTAATSLVQVYNIKEREWSAGPELQEERAHAASIGIDSGGGLPSRVIVMGGYGRNKLNSVEMICGEKIQMLAPMIKPRHAFCAALLEGMIVVFGGWSERSVERYDFRNKQWNLLNNFPSPRDCIQGAVCDGTLYAFGGVKNNKNVSNIECYDPKKDKWATVGKMLIPRLYSAIAVT